MLRFIVQFLVTCLALWLAAQVVPGVSFSDTPSLLLAAVLLGVANAVVRPILTILTFPLTIITFGLFLLVVNAAVIGLVAMLLGGFVVDGLAAGIGAAIVTGVVSWIAGWLIGEKRDRQRA
ncbi:MAG TPA: phage holin family protein [Brevundimonas sp.]|nr:phage holin family protein [Brevundimonas sp.]